LAAARFLMGAAFFAALAGAAFAAFAGAVFLAGADFFEATTFEAATFFAGARLRAVLSETPKAVAFWRVAPSVRLRLLAILEAGSLRAKLLSSFTSSFVQGLRAGAFLLAEVLATRISNSIKRLDTSP